MAKGICNDNHHIWIYDKSEMCDHRWAFYYFMRDKGHNCVVKKNKVIIKKDK